MTNASWPDDAQIPLHQSELAIEEQVHKLIGYDPDAEPSDQMSAVDYAVRAMLVLSMLYHHEGTEQYRNHEPHWICLSSQATLAASVARLLTALQGEEDPTDVAWEVIESKDNGQDMHEWAARQLQALGIEVELPPAETVGSEPT